DPGGVGQSLERAYEDGELQVSLRDADRACVDAGAVQDRLPLEQLRRARGAVPGAAFCVVGFQLEQVAAERHLQTRERGLRAVGRTSQCRLAPPRCGGLRFPPRPPLEQAAEGKRARLTGAELPDEPPRGFLLRRVVLQHVRPPWDVCRTNAHTSTTTGRIMG